MKNDIGKSTHKIHGSATAVGAALFLLLLGFFFAFPTEGQAAQYIGEAEAKSIAFRHAGVTESQATVLKLRRYDKRRIELYDIIFLTDDAKYSYEISASSGEVLAYYRNSRNGRTIERNDDSRYIGAREAESIAFDHAKASRAEVRKLKVKLDRHKGRAVYDIEFTHGRMEYEYEIDAITGEILDWEAERD